MDGESENLVGTELASLLFRVKPLFLLTFFGGEKKVCGALR
jgi:hypothetical protein